MQRLSQKKKNETLEQIQSVIASELHEQLAEVKL